MTTSKYYGICLWRKINKITELEEFVQNLDIDGENNCAQLDEM